MFISSESTQTEYEFSFASTYEDEFKEKEPQPIEEPQYFLPLSVWDIHASPRAPKKLRPTYRHWQNAHVPIYSDF